MVSVLSAPLQFAQISAGLSHSCGLTPAGDAYCWGRNESGELGDGTVNSSRIPVAVVGGLTFASIAAGDGHSCALTAGGAAYCWGANFAGQLGTGASGPELCRGGRYACSRQPVPVARGLTFTVLSNQSASTCGLTTTGAAYCWGDNAYGNLGDGTFSTRNVPSPVYGNLSFRMLSAGHFHTCAVTVAQAAFCWGFNASGQLGIGNKIGPERCSAGWPCSRKPVAVVGGFTFSAVSAGAGSSCGLTTAGAARCWGLNTFGQLGNGSTNPSVVPVSVETSLRFVTISAGTFHTCATIASGAAFCWGQNSSGQLGIGTSAPGSMSLRPLPVVGGLAFVTLDAGENHVCGTTPAAIGYCWGSNYYGQLGIPTVPAARRPMRVGVK